MLHVGINEKKEAIWPIRMQGIVGKNNIFSPIFHIRRFTAQLMPLFMQEFGK